MKPLIWMAIFVGMFIISEMVVAMADVSRIVTGLAPRIVWWQSDGSIYMTESVPIGIDPHEYATKAMMTDVRKNDYYVIDGG